MHIRDNINAQDKRAAIGLMKRAIDLTN